MQITCINLMYNPIKKYLMTNGIRLTPARDAVIKVFIKHKMPLTVSQVIEYSKYEADDVTFYRIVKTFVNAGIIKEVELDNTIRYELSELFLPHHHHITCISCGKVADITDKSVEDAVDKIGKSHKFQIESHIFELRGLCHDCI